MGLSLSHTVEVSVSHLLARDVNGLKLKIKY
jgi:hypothetical protein